MLVNLEKNIYLGNVFLCVIELLKRFSRNYNFIAKVLKMY